MAASYVIHHTLLWLDQKNSCRVILGVDVTYYLNSLQVKDNEGDDREASDDDEDDFDSDASDDSMFPYDLASNHNGGTMV